MPLTDKSLATNSNFTLGAFSAAETFIKPFFSAMVICARLSAALVLTSLLIAAIKEAIEFCLSSATSTVYSSSPILMVTCPLNLEKVAPLLSSVVTGVSRAVLATALACCTKALSDSIPSLAALRVWIPCPILSKRDSRSCALFVKL